MINDSKRAQMPAFGWVFAIIIGIMILFLAGYLIGKMIRTNEYESEVEMARGFDIILNPFASIGGIGPVSMGKTVRLAQETALEFSCDDTGLGSQGLMLKTKSSFGGWGDLTEEMSIYDKYIYSENAQGKNFYILSKSFELPFRIDELIYIVSDDYCFINAPEKMNEQFENLNMPKIKFDADDCEGKNVCFGIDQDYCDVAVEGSECEDEFFCDNIYEHGSVKKKGERDTFYFATDAMLYAAIFSDYYTYDCNFNRLMNRLDLLCDIYKEKIGKMNPECNADSINNELAKLKADVQELKELIKTGNDAGSMAEQLYSDAEMLGEANSDADCSVF